MGTEQSKLTEVEIKNREIQRVDTEMRRKMQKNTGSRFNMKVVLRGDRNVGKSCLMRRLQGQGFNEAYIPSESITTAHIHWNYKASDDVVVVEVWDVVDKGKERKRSSSNGLKFSYSPTELNQDDLSDEEQSEDIDQKLTSNLARARVTSSSNNS
ncbi:Rab-like protein [Acrasis kona]|uniref:Rab-like protein n=1 Tax=Acrasis kona TaxID=1008807 RepID=A0AAW2Z519_9EUKA